MLVAFEDPLGAFEDLGPGRAIRRQDRQQVLDRERQAGRDTVDDDDVARTVALPGGDGPIQRLPGPR